MRGHRLLLPVAALLAGAAWQPLAAQQVAYADLEDVLGEPVTTSVIGKPQRASDVPASLTIVTRDEIERSPARSVPDLLKIYAGVDVNRWTAGQSDVGVRGGVQTYNARLLVLVNGRQVYLDHYGMTDWNLLGVQLDEIQQIELVRGPASALFGFNAAAGVVNIVTVDPNAGRHASATVEGGTHGYARVAGAVALPIGEAVGIKLSGGHQREDERAIPDLLYRPAVVKGVYADSISGELTLAPRSTTRIALQGGWADNRQLEFLPSQLLAEQRFRSETAGLVIDQDTAWGSVTGRAYTNWLDASYGSTTQPSDMFYALSSAVLRNRITVAQASTLVRLGEANTLRVGVEYRDNQLHSAYQFSTRVGYRNGAVSGMLDLHPTGRLALSVAARVDRLSLGQSGPILRPALDAAEAYDRTITRPSFNVGAVLKVGTEGQLRVNGGRGLQSPSLADFGTRVTVPMPTSPLPLFTAGDPRLDPSVVWSGEMGYAQRIGTALKFDGSVFYTRTDDVIATPGSRAAFGPDAVDAPVLVTRFANIGSFESYGAQIAASGTLAAHLGWQANYTWTHVVQQLAAGLPPFAFAFSPRATTPAHVANLVLDYERSGWSVAAVGHFTAASRQYAFLNDGTLQLVPVRRAVDVDLKVSRALGKGLSAYVAGENLGDASGAYGSPIPADRRLRAGLRLDL